MICWGSLLGVKSKQKKKERIEIKSNQIKTFENTLKEAPKKKSK